MKKIILLLLLIAVSGFAQTFSVEEYSNFLHNNRNMVPEELINMHNAGIFLSDFNLNNDDVLYYDTIVQKYSLTADEKELLSNNGFMVSERLAKETFGQQMIDIYHKDLPVFISADAILHAFHRSYDLTLMQVEYEKMLPLLQQILQGIHSKLPELAQLYTPFPELEQSLRDVDIYVTVPLLLLGANVLPVYDENSAEISTLLNYVYSEGVVEYPLFAETPRKIDFSQFTPRGHYISEIYPELENYFRGMMWLGRTELYLTSPEGMIPKPTFADVKRQVIDACIISELAELSGIGDNLQEFEDIIAYFVGEQDNVTLANLNAVLADVNVTAAYQLLDSAKVVEFQESLLTNDFAAQKILSQIMINNPMDPGEITPASAFMLLGQRFVVDSYVTGSVVFDKIKFNGVEIKRMLPSTLDILFSLGNDASAQLLQPELEEYKYSTNLAAVRYLVDSYDEEHWKSSIYYMWLNAIRKLNPPEVRDELPQFMQSAAWWQEKMNSQLSSWTELRHDNLLYAKQSYTGGVVCSYPYSYVEPDPEFFNWMKSSMQEIADNFELIDFSPYNMDMTIAYFEHFSSVCDTLASVAAKELSGESLTDEEISFLHSMLYENLVTYNEPPYTGWYPKLFLSAWMNDFLPFTTQDYIVADYHTSPTDEGGSPVGWVAHAGTGPIDLAVVVAEHPSGENIAFVGPVASYHEYTTTNFKRINDDEWTDQYMSQASRPEWVNIYLADENGEMMAAGAHLITSLETEDESIIPETEILVANYPNPFNPSTYISYSIPYNLTNSKVELKVYDITGKLITTLVNNNLPAGNYVSKWDGTNSTGQHVSSGVYIYEVRVGDKLKAGKMNLVK
ncbi:MAG: hypothetical protein SCALA702_02510 [Melioribacteraceae bacterium]|nr:MAG: hypothetical protein SCALA702_02510 [Melioribacteraceae bacterium]